MGTDSGDSAGSVAGVLGENGCEEYASEPATGEKCGGEVWVNAARGGDDGTRGPCSRKCAAVSRSSRRSRVDDDASSGRSGGGGCGAFSRKLRESFVVSSAGDASMTTRETMLSGGVCCGVGEVVKANLYLRTA